MTGPPPRTLAIDTSLAGGGVAALDGDRITSRTLARPPDHARLLAALLRDAAAELGWTPRDVELVAVIRGPGSFTGLRVGVTTAKAVAWAAAARLVAVSTFEVIAWQTGRSLEPQPPDHRAGGRTAAGRHDGPLAIAIDAGRGEVFAAAARPAPAAATGWQVGPAAIVTAADWLATLPAGTVLTGPAVDLHPVRRRDLVIATEAARRPTAAAAGAVARLRAASGESHDPLTLVPDYLRPSYADEKAARTAGEKTARGGH